MDQAIQDTLEVLQAHITDPETQRIQAVITNPPEGQSYIVTFVIQHLTLE